jgi:hypothetical protein
MSYKLDIIENSAFLHVIVTGRNTKKNVIAYLKEVLQECVTRKYRKVLIEERLVGRRLETFPVFEVVSGSSQDAVGKFDAIAYVDVNAEGSLMKFAETVAINRGLPVVFFATLAEAKKWLEEGT